MEAPKPAANGRCLMCKCPPYYLPQYLLHMLGTRSWFKKGGEVCGTWSSYDETVQVESLLSLGSCQVYD